MEYNNNNMQQSVNESLITPQEGDKLALCITLPAHIEWNDYEKELEKVADNKAIMNFKVSSLPCKVSVGDRCYVCHRGNIIGWMEITGFCEQDDFTCTTTGRKWRAGSYIQRSGKFHYLEEPIPHKGFQGYRYIKEID